MCAFAIKIYPPPAQSPPLASPLHTAKPLPLHPPANVLTSVQPLGATGMMHSTSLAVCISSLETCNGIPAFALLQTKGLTLLKYMFWRCQAQLGLDCECHFNP